jgi:hypothetical protein
MRRTVCAGSRAFALPDPMTGLLRITMAKMKKPFSMIREFAAAVQRAAGEPLWFGRVLIAGFALHPLVPLFALSGSLVLSRMRSPKP